MARFRLRSEVRVSKYWEEEEKKICRICGGKERHVWEVRGSGRQLAEKCRMGAGG